jgi:hypothetical protein
MGTRAGLLSCAGRMQLHGSAEAGDFAGVALEAFQHGQDREGDGGGNGLGDQVGVGVGDIATDRGERAADETSSHP